jgi:putative membrane protein
MSAEAPRERRGLLAWAGVVGRGGAMGVAELVPGVSGGTIAFVTGIYLELVGAIRAVDAAFLRLLVRGRLAEAWRHVNAGFLLALALGMGAAVVGLASTIEWLLRAHEILLWAFFFGLILASVVHVARHVAPWDLHTSAFGILGVVLGLVLSGTMGLPVVEHPAVTFAAGAVAVCAWILPGVSGSFMLLLLGQYPRVIRALAELDLSLLAVLAAGCVTGLLLFSRLLTWLLRHHYRATLALLCGFMAGSLQKLWPWRQTLSYYLDADGEAVPVLVTPVSPTLFQEMYGEDPLVAGAVLALCAGLAVVVLLDRLSRGRGA